MPALKAFGRRWAVASDDFVFPALTELLFRAAWVTIIIVLIAVHATSGGFSYKCDMDLNLAIFYFATLVLYTTFVVLSLIIAVVSSRGTIMDETPRKSLPILLYLRLALFLPEIALNLYGSFWLFNPVDTESCDSFIKEAVPVAQAIIIISWILFIGSIVLCIVIFDPLGREPISPAHHFNEFSETSNAQVWERRCKWLCFCFAGAEGEYSEIGHMLAEYFIDTDLVATDVAAGMALLAVERQNDIDHKAHPSHYPLDTIPSWMNLNNALHFMPWASTMYGWPFYIFAQGCGGCCRLCNTSCKNCCLKTARHARVTGDNCCRCNLATLKHHISDLEFSDIVTLDFRNRLYEVPFMVCADRQKKVIVVAIRGTLSLADAVTDITARAEPFSPNEVPPPMSDREASADALWYAHKGILMASRWVVKRLVDDGVLQQAFDSHPECSQGVVIVGHSLGAGTAALVAILLKNRRDPVLVNKELRCFAYAPPGGLVSQELNECVAQNLICSVTLSGDLVPRLSLPNMLRLKNDMIRALRRSRRPKYQIFGGILCSKACCVKINGDPVLSEIAEDGYLPVPSNDYQSLLPGSPINVLTAEDTNSGSSSLPCMPRSIAAEPKLYPPGRVLTINENINANHAVSYTATFCDPSKCFCNITIGTDMIRHHLPHTLHNALVARPREVTSAINC